MDIASKRTFFHSLQVRLVASICAAALIPLAIVGVIVLNRTMTGFEQQKAELLKVQAENIQSLMDQQLQNAKSQLQILKAQADILLLLEMANQHKSEQDLPRTKTMETTLKNAVKDAGGLYESILVSGKDGTIVLEGNTKRETIVGSTIFEASDLAHLKTTKELYAGKPFRSKVSEKMVIPVTVPINSLSDYLGNITILFDLERFTGKLDEIQIGSTGYISVMSSDGFLIYNIDPTLIMTKAEWVPDSFISDGTPTFELLPLQAGKYAIGYNKSLRSGWITLAAMTADEYHKESSAFAQFLTLLILLLLIPLAFICYRLVNMVVRPITLLSRGMSAVSNGHLHHLVNYKSSIEMDMLRDGFTAMTTTLRELVDRIKAANTEIITSSGQLTHSSQVTLKEAEFVLNLMNDLSEGSQTQAINMMGIGHQMAEMSSRIQHVHDAAKQIVVETTSIRDSLSIESTNIKELRLKSENNSVLSHEADSNMQQLHNEIKQIQKVTSTITRIAGNTNMLALNAAIEAARAGIHGYGISVVAEEIRALSDQATAESAIINNLVQSILTHTDQTRENIHKVEVVAYEQSVRIARMNETFDHIFQVVDDIKQDVERILLALSDMNKEKDIVIQVVDQASQFANQAVHETHKARNNIEELESMMQTVAACAVMLDTLSDSLHKEVHHLITDEADETCALVPKNNLCTDC